jgi:hypothetical protein
MAEVKRPPRIDGTGSHYACVPRIIAEDARQHDLAHDECLIMGVIISAAMVADRERRFAGAMEAGGKDIDEVIRKDKAFARRWKWKRQAKLLGLPNVEAPQRKYIDRRGRDRLTYNRGNVNKRAAKAGSAGFGNGMKRERARTLGEHVTFRITRRALLCRAHLGTSGQHFLRLDEILDRLCHEITLRDFDSAPLIKIEYHGRDELVVTVFAHWLALPYVPVPLPWPMRSAPAVFLRLWLQTIPTGRHDRGYSSISELGERIRIFEPLRTVRRALSRAMEVINASFLKIALDTTGACRDAKTKNTAFKIDFFEKNKVSISNCIKRIRVPRDAAAIKPIKAPLLALNEMPDAEGEHSYREMRKEMEREAHSRAQELRRNRARRAAMAADNE